MAEDSHSMKSDEEDVLDVAAATQRRPDFCAEALSPGIRIGLLLLELTTAAMLFSIVLAMGLWPEAGLLAVNEFVGVLGIGLFVGMTFVVLLVYGALLANNPRLSGGERTLWYVMFAIAGPVALPVYWFKEVWPVKYQPIIDEGKLSPARGGPPPYKREENETQVLPRYT